MYLLDMKVSGELEEVISNTCLNQRCVSLMLIANFVTIELYCRQHNH